MPKMNVSDLEDEMDPGRMSNVRDRAAQLLDEVAGKHETDDPPAAGGWTPWTESKSGDLTPPDLGDLAIGETIESRYEYDRDRLIIKAWNRKITAPGQ